MISRYTRDALAKIWSDEFRVETWLSVELAVCSAMEEVGLVERGTAADIQTRVRGKLSAARILEIEATTKHDVIAFLTHVEELVGPQTRFLHLGMTSSDVLDTTTALQCAAAGEEILKGVSALRSELRKRAFAHKNVVCMGRSHGMHAEPLTVGLVFARFYAEVTRSEERLVRAMQQIRVGKIAGAVGAYTNISPKVESLALGKLGLLPETVASQVVARDRHAEFLTALAFLGTAIEQIAVTVRHWQRSEVGEAEEGFTAGQKGSSAMPHKKNPILSENVTGLARMLRHYAHAAMDNIVLWHERDISHSSVERMILPDATATADFMVIRAASLVKNLVVKEARIAQNLAQSQDVYFSEAVLLALIQKGLLRQKAYEMVQRSALKCFTDKTSFVDEATRSEEISALLSAQEIREVCSVPHHLRHVDDIFVRTFGVADE